MQYRQLYEHYLFGMPYRPDTMCKGKLNAFQHISTHWLTCHYSPLSVIYTTKLVDKSEVWWKPAFRVTCAQSSTLLHLREMLTHSFFSSARKDTLNTSYTSHFSYTVSKEQGKKIVRKSKMSAVSLLMHESVILQCKLSARTTAFSGQNRLYFIYLYISLSLSTLLLQHKALQTKLTECDKLTLMDCIVRNALMLYVQSLVVKQLKNSCKSKRITRPKPYGACSKTKSRP